MAKCWKQAYASKGDAMRQVRRHSQGGGMYAYRCPHCGQWHLAGGSGHKRVTKKRRG